MNFKELGRRKFLGINAKAFAIFAVMSGGLSQMALSCADVWSKILQYTAVGLQSFQSIVDLLVGEGAINPATGSIIDTVITLVKSGFADLQTAVAAYNSAPATSKTTLAGKVSVALAVLQEDLQQFWSDLSIPDPKLASTVEGLCGIILSVLAGFATQLPAPVGIKPRAISKRLTVSAKTLSVADFKKQVNATLEANGYGKYRRF